MTQIVRVDDRFNCYTSLKLTSLPNWVESTLRSFLISLYFGPTVDCVSCRVHGWCFYINAASTDSLQDEDMLDKGAVLIGGDIILYFQDGSDASFKLINTFNNV